MNTERGSHESEPLPNWLSLISIHVTSGSSEVYGNGRQQIQIQLDAKALNNMSISAQEWGTLRAVIQVGELEYLELPKMCTSPQWGYSTARDNNFDYYLGGADTHLDPAPSSSEFDPKLIYIHSTASTPDTIVLRAAITKDNGKVYYSDKNSGLDYKVQLDSRRPPVYSFPADYIWTETHTKGDIGIGANFVVEHSFSLANVGFSRGTFDSADTHGMIRWHTNTLTERFASHVGMALVGTDPTIYYDPRIKLPDDFKTLRMETAVQSDTTSSLVVLVQGDNAIPYDSDSSDIEDPLKIMALDRHGNGHKFTIAFTPSGSSLEKRTKLQVSVAGEFELPPERISQAGAAVDQKVANIEFFQVKGVGSSIHNSDCPLYPNGYQQTYVDVVLRPVNANREPVALTDEDIRKIKIVDYLTGANLSSQYQITRSRSDLDKKFQYFTGTSASHLEPAQNDTAVKFWIKTTAEKSRQIAATIEINGTHYHTHDANLPPGGTTESGRSNSSAKLSMLSQNYHYRAEHFNLQRTDEISNDQVDVDLYTISLFSNTHKIVYSHLPDGQVEVCCVDLNNGRYNIIVVWRFDEPRKVDIALGLWQSHPRLINHRQGFVTAARVKTPLIFGRKTSVTPLRCEVRDQYGNPHYVTVHPAGHNGSNHIELRD
nr:hypothetical protein [uncultured Pseudomonas sp.]